MNQITIKYRIAQNSSGILYYAEEETQEGKQKAYYAYNFTFYNHGDYFLREYQTLKLIKNPNQFRKHKKLQKINGIDYMLFEYYNGGQFLNTLIIEHGEQKKSIAKTAIQSYLSQLLDALYQLHLNQIPGRLFSVNNILLVESTGSLVLMDFGFGPDIKQDDLDILAPPEYLKSIIDQKEDQVNFDQKFDTWLIGAFLYNLIKIKQINKVEVTKNQLERFRYNQIQQYYDYLSKINYIECRTERYSEQLLSLVEALLTCNKEKRLSFYEIYRHQYVKNLQLPKQQEYEDFYKNFNDITDYFKKFVDSGLLSPSSSSSSNGEKPKSQQDSETNNQYFNNYTKVKSKEKPQIIIEEVHSPKYVINKNFPDYAQLILNKPKFDQKFDNYWFQIQLDYLKCYLLADLAEKVKTQFSQYNHPLEQIFVYVIKKMHFIIQREVSCNLKSEFYNGVKDENWKNILDKYSNYFLKSEVLENYSESLKQEIKNIFKQQKFQDQLNQNSSLPEKTRKSILDDRVQNYNMIQTSEEFYANGYNQALEILFQYLKDLIMKQGKSDELQYFNKQVFICLCVTTSFTRQRFQIEFQGLNPQSESNEPKDMMYYFGFAQKN